VETQQTPMPKPIAVRTPSALPAVSTHVTPSRTSVHPDNPSMGAQMVGSNRKSTNTPKPIRSLNPTFKVSASAFTPSSQVPRLSAHFAKHQVGGDLAKAISDAKQRVDLGAEEDLLSPDILEQPSPLGAAPPGARTIATGARTGALGLNTTSVPRPPSRKGHRQPAQPQAIRPRPSPLAPAQGSGMSVQQESGELPDSPHSQDHSLDLSPHTADSNPGLVSDLEDDDHGSASESEDGPAPHPSRQLPVTGGQTCADNMEIDVAVEDEIDGDGVIIRRNSISADDRMRGTGGNAKFGAQVKRS
jgi:ADA HAT complex component 1